ncbi:glycosyltransferase family 9 protein [Streptomyces sp. NPDC058326]|uniref:glycosyltransferase family 9 protein n=1 Tax=Streptomyces sp. NPDC058326 TaxID=3346447 RepID=UPI0036F19342
MTGPRAGGEAGGGRAPAGRARPTVLVLRALGLGDALTGLPALRALRRGLPGHEIVLAAPAGLAPVVRATGAVDRLLITRAPGREVPAVLPWAGRPPELAVDLHGRGPLSHRLLVRLAPGRIWAFRHPEVPEVTGPEWEAGEHERDRWCRLLRWYGLDADPGDVRLPPPPRPSPAPDAVVLHPGADAPARRWPPDRFAAVARALRGARLRVVVTAGPGEEAYAREVARRAGLPPGSVRGGRRGVPFGELCALVAGARCVVVGDTGLAHLATAFGTPSVVLFGPVSPLLWGPPAEGPHRALWHPAAGDGEALRPGDAHGTAPDPRLLRVTVDEVLTAVGDVAGGSAPESPAALGNAP